MDEIFVNDKVVPINLYIGGALVPDATFIDLRSFQGLGFQWITFAIVGVLVVVGGIIFGVKMRV